MATTIDEVLGVETTGINFPVEQIPYQKNPVPFADLLQQPQPVKGLIHPDNVPPVLANLNAMPSDGGQQAETVHSTNHALDVNIKSGGGGGFSPVVIPDPQGEQQLVLGVGQTDHVDYNIPAFVLGIQFCWRWTAAAAVAGLYIGSLILRADGDGIGSLPICFSFASNQIGGIPGGVYNWFLPEPLDVSGWFPPAPGVFRIEAFNNSNADAIAVSINPFFG